MKKKPRTHGLQTKEEEKDEEVVVTGRLWVKSLSLRMALPPLLRDLPGARLKQRCCLRHLTKRRKNITAHPNERKG